MFWRSQTKPNIPNDSPPPGSLDEMSDADFVLTTDAVSSVRCAIMSVLEQNFAKQGRTLDISETAWFQNAASFCLLYYMDRNLNECAQKQGVAPDGALNWAHNNMDKIPTLPVQPGMSTCLKENEQTVRLLLDRMNSLSQPDSSCRHAFDPWVKLVNSSSIYSLSILDSEETRLRKIEAVEAGPCKPFVMNPMSISERNLVQSNVMGAKLALCQIATLCSKTTMSCMEEQRKKNSSLTESELLMLCGLNDEKVSECVHQYQQVYAKMSS